MKRVRGNRYESDGDGKEIEEKRQQAVLHQENCMKETDARIEKVKRRLDMEEKT